jgi:hypothetical protein
MWSPFLSNPSILMACCSIHGPPISSTSLFGEAYDTHHDVAASHEADPAPAAAKALRVVEEKNS